MTEKEIRTLIERRRKEWRYGSSIEAKYRAEECDDILELMDEQEEPVSEDLEEFALQYAGHHAPYDSCMQEVEDAVKAGANWQKTKDESVTQDLGEYVNELSKQFPEVSFAKLSRIAVRVAKWQIAKLMKDSTDVTVHIDASNYPYIPQIELYDYDKDVPLAKEGDKYKVVLINEK